MKRNRTVISWIFALAAHTCLSQEHSPVRLQPQPLAPAPSIPFPGPIRTRSSDTVRYPFPDTISYHLNLIATGIINNTNSSNSFLLNNSFTGSAARKNLSLSTTNNWVYGKQLGVLTNNDFSSVLDLDLFKSVKRFYYWSLVSYTTSVSLGIHSQLQTGAGGAFSIIDGKETYLVVSDGLIYEKGDLYDSLYNGNGPHSYRRDLYEVPRNSLRLLYHWVIKGIFILDGTGFFQNSLSDRQDYVIKGTQSLSIKLQKWLSFTTSLVYNKFTRTGAENSLFSLGITIDKHF